uniref:carbonic anhydrase n=1 Tax=Acetabularia acetabulum TaxID=35845 RepID=Q9SWA0_ACEAT|nr:putative carbonic anhydrase 1 [Acetabularia acetabulum]
MLSALVLCQLVVLSISQKDFNYKLGGDDWPGLCATGNLQSPIDVRFSEPLSSLKAQTCEISSKLEKSNPGRLVLNRAGLPQATFQFGSSDKVTVANVGGAIVWLFDDDFSLLNLPIEGGKLDGILQSNNKGLDRISIFMREQIEVVQARFINFHVHSVSEHMFNGFLAPLEGHFVMQIDQADLQSCPEAGCLAVVGVHFQHSIDDTPNQFIQDTLQLIGGKWPDTNGQSIPASGSLNFDQLVPHNPSYMLYSGSLTTPPCTEGVLWHVIQQPMTVSIAQVAELQNAIGFERDGLVRNNRRIQPINNRDMIYHDCI